MLSVFIVSSHLMFGYGLENLLRRNTDLKILGQETNIRRAINQIKELKPEVVIIYADESHHSSQAIILEILNANPDTKVIALNLQNNNFYIYQAAQWVTTSLEDLLNAIKDSPPLQSQDQPNTAWINNGWQQKDQPGEPKSPN
jgi:DNA-binding NarL/FixJ family response regulator